MEHRSLACPLPRILPVVALVGVALACSESSQGPASPAFRSATVSPNQHNTISAAVSVTATGYDSVFVRYWHSGAPARRTPSHAFGADSIARVPVLGLDTAAAYTLEVNLVIGDAPPVAADSQPFQSGSLPAWIPAAVAQGSDTTQLLILCSSSCTAALRAPSLLWC